MAAQRFFRADRVAVIAAVADLALGIDEGEAERGRHQRAALAHRLAGVLAKDLQAVQPHFGEAALETAAAELLIAQLPAIEVLDMVVEVMAAVLADGRSCHREGHHEGALGEKRREAHRASKPQARQRQRC